MGRATVPVLLLAMVAATPPAIRAQGQDPPPAKRVDTPQGGEAWIDPAVAAMQGKPVRVVTFAKAERPGLPVRVVEAAMAESWGRVLTTRVGEPFEARKVSADCQALWDDRRLVVAAYAAEVDGGVRVTFEVEREVEIYAGVEFVGLAGIDRPTADALLGLYPDRQVTRTEAEAMRKVLLARYRRDGYAFCSIAVEEMPVPDALPGVAADPGRRLVQRLLRFVVDEGPKVTVREISFRGNASFLADPAFGFLGVDDYLLRDSRLQSGPARGLINGGVWSREILDEDLDRLRLFYRTRGFLDATVDVADVVFTPSRDQVDIAIVIVEGPRYRIRSVRVAHVDATQQPLVGSPLYPVDELQRELKVQPGEFYSHDRLQGDVAALEDFYGRRGHPSVRFPGMSAVPDGCRVFPPLETYGTAPEVDVVFQVSEGVPKRLRDVVIRGNRFTRDAVIRRRFRTFPGDRIDMVEVKRSLRSIAGTRYFNDAVSMLGPRLQLEPVPGQPEYVDIGLDVADGSTGRLQWGAGISTGEGVRAQITFSKSNFDLTRLPSSPDPITVIGEMIDNKAFHGGGQDLNMLLAPGSRYSQFQITFREPDVFGQHLDTWELRVSGRRTIRRLTDGYTSDIFGADVGLSHNFSDEFNAGIAAREESIEIDDLAADATSLAFTAEGRTELRGLRLHARYRDHDDVFRPTSGFDAGITADLIGGPLGGETSLTKFTHSANLYVPLAENAHGHRTVLHVEHFLGFANAFDDSADVFVTERFYMGGANLRGFDFRRAGPKQFGRPLGGEAVWTQTTEIFFPLVPTRLDGDLRDRELVRGVIFNDFGLLGLSADDPTFGELRGSWGIGLRIEIPVLEIPIALDLGWPYRYEDSDDRRQLYFSITR